MDTERAALIERLAARDLEVSRLEKKVGELEAGREPLAAALRAVGKYIKDHGATVTAMYLSNVEQYLRQDGKWSLFCANVASMPLDDSSTFIRSGQGYGGGGGRGLSNSLGSMLSETRGCTSPGPVPPLFSDPGR